MTPYASGLEHLQDELRRLDLLLQRYLAAWRADRGGAGEGGGLYVADEQVDRLLRAEPLVDAGQQGEARSPRGDGGASPSGAGLGHAERDADPMGPGTGAAPSGDDLEDRLRTLTSRTRQREAETLGAGTDLPLVALAEQFGLERRHVDALLVALAPELDLKYETVYAYLQDDLTRKRPTVGLVLRVVGGTVGSEADHRPLFTPGSPLLDAGLLEPAGGDGPLLSRPVHVDRRIVAHLLGEDELDPALDGLAELVALSQVRRDVIAPDTDEGTPLDRLPVVPAIRDRLASVAEGLDADTPAMVQLHGPYGSGRSAAAVALAATDGRPLLRVDAERIPVDVATERLDRLAREATLRDGALHVRNLPATDREREEGEITVDLTTLVHRLDRFDGPVFLSGSDPLPPRLAAGLDRHAFAAVAFERPPFELRRSLWEQAGLPGDPAELASKFQFTPGQLEDAVATARSLADGEPTAEDVYEACRVQSRERLGDLARHVEPTFGWDDIVLPDDERRQLREVAAHIDHQGTVYSEWGFEDRFSLGTGVNVLFAGPSGTGKTMAAEILAAESGLDLYKVDLASVVSKYIGETESNLGRVFDEAESSNAILFFDEADALFGERSEVSDAHDRYANVEVDYLLERMEEHDGVVLLATNLRENLDDAFQRRLNVTIEFPLPDRDARERIWRGVFPGDTPVGDLDWAFLADFELTGGSIKNAALTAAFLAADEDVDGAVEMRHVVRGLWRELRKSGRLVSAEDFGEYRELLP